VPNVEVAVGHHAGQLKAILPYQRCANGVARPVGLGINDAHGVLLCSGVEFQFNELLRACQLRRFTFHSSPVDAPSVNEFEAGRTRSFLADLTVDPQGYEHFLRSHNSTIDRQGQKTRKLARQVGPIRFEFDCRDPAMIGRLLELKRSQYRRTYTFDIFSVSWLRKLLYQLHADNSTQPRGILSVLCAGEQPVALHFGMLEGDLIHYWFPVYDPAYSFGSPGTELFLQVAREAANRGVTAIDMGYGEQAYKEKLTNVISEMSYGVMDPSLWRRAVYNGRAALRSKFRDFKMKDRIKPLARKLMPGIGRRGYDG